jgi:transglutaminase-like putative cysteine protease
MSTSVPAGTLDRRKFAWLLVPLIAAILMHVEHLPYWVVAAVVILGLWRVVTLVRGYPLPSKLIIGILGVAGAIGVALTYRTIFGRTAGVSLLIVLVLLKLMESRTHRDAMMAIFFAFVLVVTNFMFSQTLPVALLMTLIVWLITAALVGINAEHTQLTARAKLGISGTILLQAIPLMLLLFLLFPRIQGPLWRTPTDAQSARSGLSDTMAPGSINRLTLSDDIAFRAKFDGAVPRPDQLYWRGPVLWDFDGVNWTSLSRINRLRRLEFTGVNPPMEYSVTMEPSDKTWLFALELAAQVPPNARITPDYQILFNEPVRNRLAYQMRSYLNYKTNPVEDRDDLAAALRLPPGFNPRTVALAREWRALSKDDEAIMRRALAYFREQEFVYTLTPPLLGRDSIDEFLLDTRQGFCEHYAGSFVFLMRAAGIPARVVTGYLGGDINPVDKYMVIRQSDAHAWAEVWLAAQGWIRVDPTAAVAPGRVQAGLAGNVRSGEALPFFTRTDLTWLKDLRYNWEALANAWNQVVLGFNPERQREVLSRFGMEPDWMNMSIALTLSCGTLLLGFTLFLMRRYRRVDPVVRVYLAFCARLARHGMTRGAGEGPLDFAQRAAAALPEYSGAILSISGQYIELRYGRLAQTGVGADNRHEYAAFKAEVAQMPL